MADMTARVAQARLRECADPAFAAGAPRFFKAEHIAGDVFLGLRAAPLRALAREFRDLPVAELEILLHSRFHEKRSLALLVLVLQVQRADDAIRRQVYEFYLANVNGVNNWDLVDISAPALVGGYLAERSRKPLYSLAKSQNLWQRRIAIVATQHFIRLNDFADTLNVGQRLLTDREDLIHKAVGWMLREVGKRDLPTLEGFLRAHAPAMPRTMLRYAIERFPEARRRAYLQGTY